MNGSRPALRGLSLRIRIDRSSPLPLYIQLKQAVLDALEAHQLEPGSRLPSEEELVAMTGLSRYTVRQALRELEQEGRVERVHGRGTFVSEPKVVLSIAAQLIGFSADMTQKGYRVRSQVLDIRALPAPDEVAEALMISRGAPTVLLKRLRTLDGQPFLVDTIFVRSDLCPQMETVDFTDASLFQVLETRYGLKIVRAKRTLRTVAAESWVAGLLGTDVGAPLHLLTDLAFVASGDPVQYARTLIHGARSEFVFELVAAPGSDRHEKAVLADSTNPILRREVS